MLIGYANDIPWLLFLLFILGKQRRNQKDETGFFIVMLGTRKLTLFPVFELASVVTGLVFMLLLLQRKGKEGDKGTDSRSRPSIYHPQVVVVVETCN